MTARTMSILYTVVPHVLRGGFNRLNKYWSSKSSKCEMMGKVEVKGTPVHLLHQLAIRAWDALCCLI